MMTSERPELAPRERDILRLVAQGRTNAQIRARLGLSYHTLAKTMHQLYLKSGLYRPRQSYNLVELRQHLREWGPPLFCSV
jgi:DNA-binding NarL/FixJ family response regulator